MSIAADRNTSSTVERMAAFMRDSYRRDFLEGMSGPTSMFADRVEVRYLPPRSTDGWFDGKVLNDYQPAEERVIRQVVPDAHFEDVTVITRADDQIVAVFTTVGTMRDGTPFRLPATFIYDVVGDKIVRVVGLYDQQALAPFAEAFEAAAKIEAMPLEMAPR